MRLLIFVSLQKEYTTTGLLPFGCGPVLCLPLLEQFEIFVKRSVSLVLTEFFDVSVYAVEFMRNVDALRAVA